MAAGSSPDDKAILWIAASKSSDQKHLNVLTSLLPGYSDRFFFSFSLFKIVLLAEITGYSKHTENKYLYLFIAQNVCF
jgi:hypothetical protein